MSQNVQELATTLVAGGKGILAADETVPTLTKRFDALGISSTEQSRCTYREMLFTVPGASEFISGVIMQDETIRQKGSAGTPLAHVLAGQDILPGIKVDKGAKPLAGSPTETITEGLDGLRDRLAEYQTSERGSRSGGLCFELPMHCRAAPASVQMLTRSRATRRCARNKGLSRSSNRKCS